MDCSGSQLLPWNHCSFHQTIFISACDTAECLPCCIVHSVSEWWQFIFCCSIAQGKQKVPPIYLEQRTESHYHPTKLGYFFKRKTRISTSSLSNYRYLNTSIYNIICIYYINPNSLFQSIVYACCILVKSDNTTFAFITRPTLFRLKIIWTLWSI